MLFGIEKQTWVTCTYRCSHVFIISNYIVDHHFSDTNVIDKENDTNQHRNKSRIDLNSLPTRQYLDQTVVPIVLQGLSALAKERPPDPISFLAGYLLKNKANYENPPSSSPTSNST